jgi:S-adenosylmethionine:tRNA ribosyltransferase-isomerase
MLDAVRARVHGVAAVTLHVGVGTFRPVRTENVEDHEMHSERYLIPQSTATLVTRALEEGRRILAIGTSTARALEAAATEGKIRAGSGETSLFIRPGYQFQTVRALLTNFHLPRSTLLLLVSAFAGRTRILRAYREAMQLEYRFLSFGDAMLIL